MTDHSDLIDRLRAACVGYPRASIAWPHRILHEAADALSSQSLSLSEARAENDREDAEIERLRETIRQHGVWDFPRDIQNLTVKLEAAESEIERLREALGPFAGYFGPHYPDTDDRGVPLPDDTGVGWIYLNVGDFRRASKALENGPARLADATNDHAESDLSSLRKGAEELRRSLICVKQQCETAAFNIGQREHDEAVVRSFQSIADYCARALVSGSREDGA